MGTAGILEQSVGAAIRQGRASGREAEAALIAVRRVDAKRAGRKRIELTDRLPEVPRRTARAVRPSTFSFETVPADRWERCFGSEEERRERFRQAREETKERRRRAAAEAVERNRGVQVIGDRKGPAGRMFRGVMDPGLGVVVQGRAHRNRVMRELGLREAQ